tara:strand:- start:286 stop:1008 length:723 start_codon:yes stop_codon:yes gene_type:complete
MWAYALGAIQKFKWAETITVHIILPRRDEVSTSCFTRTEVLLFRDRIRLIVDRATVESPDLNPNTEACRFCGRRVDCKALADKILPIAKKYASSSSDFSLSFWEKMDPEKVSDPETISRMKRVAQVMDRWKSAVDQRALTLAVEEGHAIPGFKLLYRYPTSKISDAADAFEALSDSISPEEFQSACSVSLNELSRAYAKANGITIKDARARVELALIEAGLIASDEDSESTPYLRVDSKL